MTDPWPVLREFFESASLEGLAEYEQAAFQLDGLELESLPELNLAVLHSVTVDPVIAYLKVAGYRAGLKLNIAMYGLDEIETLALDSDSPLYRNNPDAVLILLYLETASPKLANQFTALTEKDLIEQSDMLESRIQGLAQSIRDRCNSLILVSNFQAPVRLAWGILDGSSGPGQRTAIGQLNGRIARALKQSRNGYVIDIDRLTAALGDSAANDPRNWHRSRAPWKPALLNAIAEETVRHLRPLRSLNKKCVVLDCDNVLWGGGVGDLGVSEIVLGAEPAGSPYVSLQYSLRAIASRGVILCVCSKNEPEVVEEVFKQHPKMILTHGDVAAWRVNWTDKAENIMALSEELNISTDSMVFVDDSPFECGRVRHALPEVEVVCLDGNPGNFQRIIEQLDYFDPLSLTEEDVNRTSLYRAESRRRSLADESATLDDYLASLEMVVEASIVDDSSLSRMSQLVLKTNQFNLTTPRYTEAEIRTMLEDPDCIVAGLRVSDVYGDSGLVGAAVVFNKQTHFELDTFLMSCRVIGRGAEDAFLAAMTQAVASIASKASMEGSKLLARYIPTKKNAMIKDFLPVRGFRPVEGNDSGSVYALESQAIPLAPPSHVRLVNGLCR